MSDDLNAMLKRWRDAMGYFHPETIPDQGDRFNIPLQGDERMSEHGNGPFIIMHEHYPEKELVSLPRSNETITTLWEIACKVAEDGVTIAIDDMGDRYCMFCNGDPDYGDVNSFHHQPECIVLKARALVKEKGA